MNKKLQNKMTKPSFKLEAVPKDNKTVVYLYGDIVDERPIDFWTGEEIQGDYITPKEVRDLLDASQGDEIELHINSYGGSVFASVSIFNYLRNLKKPITTVNDGLCASGASLIFMAGDKKIMPKNTTLMIHRASSFGWGNCNELRQLANTLEKLDTSTVFETYKANFNGTDEELLNLIDSETWISADEAKDYGLCDEVISFENKEETNKEETKHNKEEIVNTGKKIMMNFANLKLKGVK